MKMSKVFLFSTIATMLHFVLCCCDIPFYHGQTNTHTGKFVPEPNYNELNISDAKHFYNRKNCGKSLKHLGGLLLDKSDKESKLIVEGSVVANKLVLKIGNVKEKEIPINNIILPIETLSKKCINIRQTKIEDSAVLCLSNTATRNFWINSITDAVLCNLTKLSGKLPEFNYLTEEDEKEEVEKKEKEKEEGKEAVQKENVEKVENIKKVENIEKEKETTEESRNIEQTEKDVKNEEDEDEQIRKKILREEFDDELGNDEEKRLTLRIAKGKYGYAKVNIDGKSIDEIQKDEELQRILKNEEKEMAKRMVEDLSEMDEIDDMDDF